MSGVDASARASSTRRLVPPERVSNGGLGVELEPGQDPLHLLVVAPAVRVLRGARPAPAPAPPATTSKTVPASPCGISWETSATLSPCWRKISPPSGSISPLISFSSVDLPVPLRPIRQSRSPASSCRLIPSSSGGPPKATLTFRKLISAMESPP